MTNDDYIAALNKDLMVANARREDAEAERDRAWQTINEIEKALTDHGVAITSPLVDAVLGVLYEREQLLASDVCRPDASAAEA